MQPSDITPSSSSPAAPPTRRPAQPPKAPTPTQPPKKTRPEQPKPAPAPDDLPETPYVNPAIDPDLPMHPGPPLNDPDAPHG